MQTPYQTENGAMPFVVEPSGDVEGSPHALVSWITAHRQLLNRWLHKHGAVLLRAFGVSTPEIFRGVAAAFCPSSRITMPDISSRFGAGRHSPFG